MGGERKEGGSRCSESKGVKEENARELSQSENADSRKEWIEYAVMRNLLILHARAEKTRLRNVAKKGGGCSATLEPHNLRYPIRRGIGLSIRRHKAYRHRIGQRYRWRSLAVTHFAI